MKVPFIAGNAPPGPFVSEMEDVDAKVASKDGVLCSSIFKL